MTFKDIIIYILCFVCLGLCWAGLSLLHSVPFFLTEGGTVCHALSQKEDRMTPAYVFNNIRECEEALKESLYRSRK